MKPKQQRKQHRKQQRKLHIHRHLAAALANIKCAENLIAKRKPKQLIQIPKRKADKRKSR